MFSFNGIIIWIILSYKINLQLPMLWSGRPIVVLTHKSEAQNSCWWLWFVKWVGYYKMGFKIITRYFRTTDMWVWISKGTNVKLNDAWCYFFSMSARPISSGLPDTLKNSCSSPSSFRCTLNLRRLLLSTRTSNLERFRYCSFVGWEETPWNAVTSLTGRTLP